MVDAPTELASRNLAYLRAAYQSSAANFDNTAHLATDGDLGGDSPVAGASPAPTEWISGTGDEQWIYVDLGAPSTVDGVTLHWGSGYAQAYRIDVSDDATSWAEVYSTAAGDGGKDEIPLTPARGRFVRMFGTKVAGSDRYSLKEFEVHGTGGATVVPRATPRLLADGTLYLEGGNWRLRRASYVQATGAEIAEAGFDDSSWIAATVPGTVLRSYLEIGAIPDPNFGDQQLAISDGYFTADFWYRNSFTVPASHCGRRTWLNFDGINWKADVYFNGAALGSIQGAYVRKRFDVTAQALCGATNYLAVLVHQNDSPGQASVQKLDSAGQNGGVLGADNPTIHASIGWDWIPTIRGRNTGLYDNVYLSTTGPVSILDPFVVTALPLPQTAPADLTIQVDLENNSASAVDGVLSGVIEPGAITFAKPVSLAAGERKTVAVDKAVEPALSIESPRLWWPNGYGSQDLHDLSLSFTAGGATSDTRNISFGIRQITSDTTGGVLTLQVNGKRIFVRGGNWGMSDSMMRLDREGYDTRVRLHKEQNFTMIRNWVGMTGSDDFYSACDKYGILVWDDFWLANPADGPDPTDPTMFMVNARDKIRRVRRHPSVALYCGRNEGDPPEPLFTELPAAVAELDGTRPYIANSLVGVVSGGGPYSVKDPVWYFEHERGPKIHSEIGMPNVPSIESMRAMMPADRLWPIGDMWGIHDFTAGQATGYAPYVNASYGDATGIEDFVRKAQMVNMENYKAIYEAFAAARGNGALLWMAMSAWPSTGWQTFDYFLEPTAGYFGLKKACEPLHILWDSSNDRVAITNNSVRDHSALTAEARIYDLDGTERWAKTVTVDSPADGVTDCFTISYPAGLSATHFLRLKLMDGATVLSDNFYWRGTTYKDYRALSDMPRAAVTGSAALQTTGETNVLTATVTSSEAAVALMVRLKLLRADSGERVLPTYYSDNYVSLLPGETKVIRLEFETKVLAGQRPKLVAEGWNVAPFEIAIP